MRGPAETHDTTTRAFGRGKDLDWDTNFFKELIADRLMFGQRVALEP
jgi:hypothetical protein